MSLSRGDVECGRPSGKAEPILAEAANAETQIVPERDIANSRKTRPEVRRVERNRRIAVTERVSGSETNRLVFKSVSNDGPECRRRR
jgi:hypothetical protein